LKAIYVYSNVTESMVLSPSEANRC